MKIEDVARALAADREKLIALGGDPGPTEAELFSNGIMDLNSALALAEDMTDAPGYVDMQDALAVLAAAYRKAEDRIGGLIAANDAKAAALKDNAIDLSQILGEVLVAWGAAGAPVKQPDPPADDVDPFS